jgi:hypothetical protein
MTEQNGVTAGSKYRIWIIVPLAIVGFFVLTTGLVVGLTTLGWGP